MAGLIAAARIVAVAGLLLSGSGAAAAGAASEPLAPPTFTITRVDCPGAGPGDLDFFWTMRGGFAFYVSTVQRGDAGAGVRSVKLQRTSTAGHTATIDKRVWSCR